MPPLSIGISENCGITRQFTLQEDSARLVGWRGNARKALTGGTHVHCQEGDDAAPGNMSETRIKPDYARVKREVRRLHEEFGVTAPPVDPIRISRGVGVTVLFVTFEPEKQNVSGFFDCDERAIFVNRDEYPLRQTFTIAHELGHKILHEEWAKSSDYKVLLRNADDQSDDPHEKEANAFAAHLLVPRILLDQYWKRLNVEQLSTLFAVSVPMIKNRLSFEYGIK